MVNFELLNIPLKYMNNSIGLLGRD